jgi:hypothetical protein
MHGDCAALRDVKAIRKQQNNVENIVLFMRIEIGLFSVCG